MTARNRLALGAVALIGCIVALAWALAAQSEPQDKKPIGLMTSLPIYWEEGADIGQALATDQTKHWVRKHLERRHKLVPLDTLAASDSAAPSNALQALELLILAQPRPLSPADFAALDSWLRSGGKALIFADPLLTEHSDFGLGDPRRPEGAALMSPIFTRWGLQQTFDESQTPDAHSLPLANSSIPVHQYGRFEKLAGGAAECRLMAERLIADCAMGEGNALIVGDAALLSEHAEFSRPITVLDAILEQATLTHD